MINKRGFEFSFGWLFSIIIGAVILFLAVYAAMSVVSTGRQSQDTIAGKQLGIILTPIETSLEEINKPYPIEFPARTRIYNDCYATGNFGEQKIKIATQSGIGKKWQNPGVPSTFYNKYIFSKSIVEGKKVNVMAKPFKFPYKIADLFFLWSGEERYCFVSATSEIEEELSALDISGVNFTNAASECPKNSTKICFSGSGCDIYVSTIAGTVRKNGQTLFYPVDETTLLYGAIFADPGIYECQVKRLMKRAGQLAFLYKVKSEIVSSRGCGSNLESDLLLYANATLQFNNTASLMQIEQIKGEIDDKNRYLECKIY